MKCQYLFSEQTKKNILVRHLLKVLPNMLSWVELFYFSNVFSPVCLGTVLVVWHYCVATDITFWAQVFKS